MFSTYLNKPRLIFARINGPNVSAMFPNSDKQGNIDRKDNVSAAKETYFL